MPKTRKKAAETAKDVKEPANDFDAETVKRYKNFARELSAFFFTKVPNKEILEMCETNAALEKLGKGLRSADSLIEQLFEAGKVFGGGIVSQSVQDAMREFSASFCELQEFNQ